MNALVQKEIFELKERGWTYTELSLKFNLSKSKVQQIYLIEKQSKPKQLYFGKNVQYDFEHALYKLLLQNSYGGLYPGVIKRIVRCFNESGIFNEMANKNATLDFYSNERLLSIKDFGYISLIYARKANRIYKQCLDSQCY